MDSNPPSRRSMPAIEMQRHSSLFPPRRGSQGPSHPRGKRNIAIPSIGQLAAHDLLKRFGQFWKCSGVRREFVSPLRFGQLSPLDRVAKVFARPLGDIKWRLRRPASFCFVSRTSSAPLQIPGQLTEGLCPNDGKKYRTAPSAAAQTPTTRQEPHAPGIAASKLVRKRERFWRIPG